MFHIISKFSLLTYLISNLCSPTLSIISLIIGLATALADYILGLKNKSWKLKFGSANKMLFAFIALLFVYVIYSATNFIDALEKLLVLFLPFIWMIYLQRKENNNKILELYVIAAGLISLFIVLQALGIVSWHIADLIPSASPNVLGLLDQPFTSSGVLLTTTFLNLYFLNCRSFDKYFFVWQICFVCQLMALAFLSQLSVLVALVITLLLWFIAWAKDRLNGKTALILLLILSVGAFASYKFIRNNSNKINSAVLKKMQKKIRLLTDLDFLKNSLTYKCRVNIWQQNLEAFTSESPSKQFFAKREVLALQCGKNKLKHMHNIYLQQLIEKGYIGLMLWLSIFTVIIISPCIKMFNKQRLLNLNKTYALYFGLIVIALLIEGILENWWGDREVYSAFLYSIALIFSDKSGFRASE